MPQRPENRNQRLVFFDDTADLWLFDLAEIVEFHPDRFVVRVSFENNLPLSRQTFINDCLHAILGAEWR